MSASDIFIAIILATTTLALIWCAWSLICNEQTYRTRIRIIDLTYEWDLYREYRRVSYDQHLRALQFLRDPITLYGPRVREALAKGAS